MKVDFIVFVRLGLLTTLNIFSVLAVAEPVTSSFIALGDLPYNQQQRTILVDRITPVLRKSEPPFVVHFGDFKNSSTPCTNKVYDEQLHFMETLIAEPVFYTPGDNEWTDCDAVALKEYRYSELGRLNVLREKFFSRPPKGASKLGWESQQHFPENQRWEHESVQYNTLHIVGTANGRQEILVDDKKLAIEAVETRDNANINWLIRAFSEQIQNNQSAIVFIFHGDITQATFCETGDCDPYLRYKENLVKLATYSKVPILLIHGDTNPYCIQETFLGVDKLWRLNAPGDYGLIDAVGVKVTPSNEKEPFHIRSLMEKLAPETCESGT
jgi:hypothetical protein